MTVPLLGRPNAATRRADLAGETEKFSGADLHSAVKQAVAQANTGRRR